jgi:drug/metabolite transporter (DMT)-like permease
MIDKLTKMKASLFVAVFAIIAGFGMLILLLFIEVPNSNKDIFNSSLNFVLGATTAGAVSYLWNYKKPDDK